jgi:hypothetical protein
MSGLRECPWCGEKPDSVESLRTDSGNADQIGKWAWIECGCGVRAPDVRAQYGNAKGWQDAAVEEWNRRALAKGEQNMSDPDDLTTVWLAAKADCAEAVAKEREACAALEWDVYFWLIGTKAMPCGCGNGRIPTTSFSDATAAFAAAIRKRGLTP